MLLDETDRCRHPGGTNTIDVHFLAYRFFPTPGTAVA